MKKKLWSSAVPFLLALFLVSCEDSDNPVIGTSGAEFEGTIIMYDDAGGNAIKGTISMSQDDRNNLTGKWSLANNTSGNLIGSVVDSDISINMNPNMVDNNTFLWGKVNGKIITGKWTFSGVMGPLKKGTFVAIGY